MVKCMQCNHDTDILYDSLCVQCYDNNVDAIEEEQAMRDYEDEIDTQRCLNNWVVTGVYH